MDAENFDLKVFAKHVSEQLRAGKPLTGADGVFTPLLKIVLEAALEGEMDTHLEESKKTEKNRRNGRNSKTVKSGLGPVDVETPRDRAGTFEPATLPKRQRSISSDIDAKILGLYGLGMSYGDIQKHLNEMYGLEVSDGTIGAITDRIIPEIKEWQTRPLESVYPVVWLDAMFFKVRHDGRVQKRAVYSILGVSCDGMKEVLGIYIGDAESASFWRQVLNDLQNRGVEDIIIACIDNLKGFADAVEDFFPRTEVQLCLVHQMRNSFKYVVYSDLKAVAKDLKTICRASTEEQGLYYLEQAEERWSKKYPAIFKSWRSNWDRLATFYQFPEAVRRVITTTNSIESFHRMVRKVTKTKGSFSSENAILKQVYLAVMNAHTKWHGQIYGWNTVRQTFEITFGDRLKSGDTVK
jgi:putative transposase